MEYQLSSLVSEVAGTPIVSTLATGQSFTALCQMIEAMLKSQHLPPDLSAQIKSALSDARGLQGKRDAIVHGIWVGEGGGAGRVAHRPRRYKLNMTPQPFTRAELLDRAHDLGVMSARPFSWDGTRPEPWAHRWSRCRSPTIFGTGFRPSTGNDRRQENRASRSSAVAGVRGASGARRCGPVRARHLSEVLALRCFLGAAWGIKQRESKRERQSELVDQT